MTHRRQATTVDYGGVTVRQLFVSPRNPNPKARVLICATCLTNDGRSLVKGTDGLFSHQGPCSGEPISEKKMRKLLASGRVRPPAGVKLPVLPPRPNFWQRIRGASGGK